MTASSSLNETTQLPFTGERFTPECVREIWYEHWHRYAFVREMAAGKRVLDAACGEGYGSAFLSKVAAHVIGVDVDACTVAHARERYRDQANLAFQCNSVTELDVADASVDLIVSFETIEHLAEQASMLDEFRRVLAPDGLLVISSPDREAYNANMVEPNPYHVRELDRGEFIDLLRARFPSLRLMGQKLGFHSLIWAQDAPMDAVGRLDHLILDADAGELKQERLDLPVYHLAMCAGRDDLLPTVPSLSLFADQQSSVYNHYNIEIARLIRADHRIIELERELAALKAERAGE